METTINGTQFTMLEVNHNGKNHIIYLKKEDIDRFDNYYPYTYAIPIYDENGNVVKGIWRHGRTGSKRHEHPVKYNLKTAEIKNTDFYNYGNIRNNFRYLLKVLWT